MAKFYPRITAFLAGCWAFIASLSFDNFSLSRTKCTLRRAVEYVVSAASLSALPDKAEWRIVERMCSEDVREKINIFGDHPRSTGALCSPLL